MSVSTVVVAFRMEPLGLQSGSLDGDLAHVRSLCALCDSEGGRLVAWGDGLFAYGWPFDRFEDAIGLLEKLRSPEMSNGPMWAVGVAEGDVDPLTPDGSSGHLAWGQPMFQAAAMARAARLGEVVVGDDVRAYREGRLSIVGERIALLGQGRVKGWRLDLEDPWARASEGDESGDRATLPYVGQQAAAFPGDWAATAGNVAANTGPSGQGAEIDLTEALGEMRAKRSSLAGAPASERCRASLELAILLLRIGRCEDALLDGLDALARGREAENPDAVAACLAVLAKVYDAVGSRASAVALGDEALGR